MKKNIMTGLVLFFLYSCAGTGKSSLWQEYAFEPGLDPEKTEGYALIYVQRDMYIEYLDGIKTDFHSDKIYIYPGYRIITLKFGNSYEISSYFDMKQIIRAGSTYMLSYKLTPDNKIYIDFYEKKEK